MDVAFQNYISNEPVSLQQEYSYGSYSGAYPPGTQVVYAENGQAYAVPYQYPYAGKSWNPSIPSFSSFRGQINKDWRIFISQFKDK